MTAFKSNFKWTIHRRLLFNTIALALLLIVAVTEGFQIIGGFSATKNNIRQVMDFQMAVFQKDIAACTEFLAANTVELSRHMAEHIDQDPEVAGSAFQSLNDNPQKIESLQRMMVGSLAQKLPLQASSGAFITLNATVNSQLDEAPLSRTGVYLMKSRFPLDESITLYRGMASVGKEYSITPHRKWRMEFRTDNFLGYEKLVSAANRPLSEAYQLFQIRTLPGTNDQVLLMAAPIVGRDGTFYGVCGYEISADYFTSSHEQPTTQKNLVCMLLSTEDGKQYEQVGLRCYGQGSHAEISDGRLSVSPFARNLSIFSDGNQSFVGLLAPVTFTPNNEGLALAVMIPESDYNYSVLSSTLQVGVLIALLAFFAIICSIAFTKKYLRPILSGLDQIMAKQWMSKEPPAPEFKDLFAFLTRMSQENKYNLTRMEARLTEAANNYEQAEQKYTAALAELQHAQLELQRLSYSRKTEVDPENYKSFLIGLKSLTATEKMILDYYLEGKTVKQIMELMGIKETTLRFHNRNIYSKLNVNSLKQLLQYAAIKRQTDPKDTSDS